MRKKAAILITVLAVLGAVYLHDRHEQNRMEEYAKQNNCTWIYDYYITEQPVCK